MSNREVKFSIGEYGSTLCATFSPGNGKSWYPHQVHISFTDESMTTRTFTMDAADLAALGQVVETWARMATDHD